MKHINNKEINCISLAFLFFTGLANAQFKHKNTMVTA